jgi:hypothetical protein
MKIVAKFAGKLIEFNHPPILSYVHLKNLDTNEETNATATSQKLLDLDIIHPGDEFEILIFEPHIITGKYESHMMKNPTPKTQPNDFII